MAYEIRLNTQNVFKYVEQNLNENFSTKFDDNGGLINARLMLKKISHKNPKLSLINLITKKILTVQLSTVEKS